MDGLLLRNLASAAKLKQTVGPVKFKEGQTACLHCKTTINSTLEEIIRFKETVAIMDRNESLSLAMFNQKLLKYCTNAAKCYTQEKELVARFEKLITKRDTFLAQLIKAKEADMACAEQIVDLQHQHEEAQELLDNLEKKCNVLALEQMSLETVERPDQDANEGTKHGYTVTSTSAILTEKLLNRFLTKYCNLFVRFSDSCDGVRVLSLTDNRYYEFCLNNNESQLREDIWANLATSSTHLNIWESLL